MKIIMQKMIPNVIEAKIFRGSAAKEDALLPKIPLISTDMSFAFKRFIIKFS